MNKKLKKYNDYARKAWDFFWNSDSPLSWILNIIVAIVVIKFVVYPLLGIILGTGFPLVAVLSESMEHGLYNGVICGEQFSSYEKSFDHYWQSCGSWYEDQGISKEQFKEFPFSNGFNKGDVIILWRANSDNLKVGDILVFWGNRPQPIIHRVVKIWEENGKTYYQTKGDHNSESSTSIKETRIGEERLLGKGLIRIPYVGWLKILFVEALRPFGINIQN